MLFQKRDCLSAFTSQMLFTIINIRMNHEKRGCAYLSQRVSGSHGFVLSASLVRLHLYDVCLFFFFIFFFLSFERIQKQYFSPFCIESIFITCINLSFFFPTCPSYVFKNILDVYPQRQTRKQYQGNHHNNINRQKKIKMGKEKNHIHK